jgi:two-component system, chemotaxis family, protein-glutamate methylesterase/glutaminase
MTEKDLPVTNDKIDVLVVDDSPVVRMLLVNLLESDPQIRVISAVESGQAALEFLLTTKPDVVVMDIQMPRLDGFETTRRIMETQPVPIVICTATTDPKELATTFRALEAGAVACLGKPVSPEHPEYEGLARTLIDTVKAMSEVRLVRRWPRSRLHLLDSSNAISRERALSVVGIGASTGGPPVLQTILSGLPKNFAAPILIVQHIANGFLNGLVEWLHETTGFQVHVAAHNTIPQSGHVYFAPDDLHMGLSSSGRILLTRQAPENNVRPAVSYLFRSLVDVCGANAIGVLLTGMGKDGAVELRLMKEYGAATIAQDRDTSVVHGMPGEAIQIGGATYILPSDKIADTLITLVSRRQGVKGGQA